MVRIKEPLMLFRKCWPLALLCFALVGCAKDKTVTQAGVPAPADEASGEQRSQIDGTLSRIEDLTSELGQPKEFRRLPVVVTTSDHFTDHQAACISVKGVSQFIVVKPEVFSNENGLATAGVDSTLFRVLLHEIGHCYFGRVHEHAEIEESGKRIELTVKQHGASSKVSLPLLDVTVMVPENLSVPVALEKYYVAEILGITRATTLADLAPYAPVNYVDEVRH